MNSQPPGNNNARQSLFTNAQQQQQANQPISSTNIAPSLFINVQQNQSGLFTNAQQQQYSNQLHPFNNAQFQHNTLSNAQQQQIQSQNNSFGSNLSNLQSYNTSQPSNSSQQLNQAYIAPQQFQQMQMPMNYVQPMNYYQHNISPQIHQIHEQNLGLFSDDQPLIQKAKEELKDGKIEITMKAQRSLVKLKTVTELPAMVSIKSSGGSRTSVDLICVIDNSGSMQGQKIQLVKSTVKFLLEALTPSDSNATRLCQLKCVSGENMNKFLHIVNSIYAGGGTSINSGLQLALKTIRDRKHINKVTSIFLLSDGQDQGAEHTFKQSLQQQRNKQLGVFTLHSFGFGSDHDQNLMNKLCLLKDGAFYFIKQLATLDQAFCNALGGIISLVASQITIKINNIAKNLIQGVRIKKVYGKMWEKINDKQYKIKLSQIMSGISKDFVFQLQIPSINIEIGDLDRDHNIIEALFNAKGMLNQNINGQCTLQLTLLNQSQNIPDTVENVQVIQNYLRVRATESIEQNLKKADQQKYKQAQEGIDHMIQSIQDNKKARKEKMATLITDLQQIKQKCSAQQYGHQGRKIMTSIQTSHAMQNNFQYSNCVQSTMLNDLRSKRN